MRVSICKHEYLSLETLIGDAKQYALLHTAGEYSNNRWSILGLNPWLCWMPRSTNPLNYIDGIINSVRRELGEIPETDFPVPLIIGALGYDIAEYIESHESLAVDDTSLPLAVIMACKTYFIIDEIKKECWKVTCNIEKESLNNIYSGRVNRIANLPSSSHSKSEYISAVSQIKKMISSGDCYQVNMSQRFVTKTNFSALEIFNAARDQNPTSMMALINVGEFQIISTSPERLIRKNGEKIISEPIKGTAPRDKDPIIDTKSREELLNSEKNRAELAMIVDLVRNDLNKFAQTGSVKVSHKCRLESYANVHHLVATIEAAVDPNTTWGEIFRAIFPGGSITGCPKRQAMEVIDKMEKVKRGFYCGSIGYIDSNGDGDWNIAIRTITKVANNVIFNLGGGVVYDSDPLAEHEETLHKGETIFSIV